jgi:hypothetical protein
LAQTTSVASHWYYRLLPARRERPRRRAAEKRDELAPPHSITSSATNRMSRLIVSPTALAAFRSSLDNLIGDQQDVTIDRQSHCARSLQVDDQLE